MFTPGPRRKCTPLARASRPISAPTRSARAGFHVAASAMPPAMAVAGPKLRTPIGPSAIFSRGQFKRGRSRMKKPSTPLSKSIFSSIVIWLRIESTLRSTSTEERKEGAGAWAEADNTVETIKDKATIEQNLRMVFLELLVTKSLRRITLKRSPITLKALANFSPGVELGNPGKRVLTNCNAESVDRRCASLRELLQSS